MSEEQEIKPCPHAKDELYVCGPCHVHQLKQQLYEARAEIERKNKTLENIVNHAELVGGSMSTPDPDREKARDLLSVVGSHEEACRPKWENCACLAVVENVFRLIREDQKRKDAEIKDAILNQPFNNPTAVSE